jgi:DNA-directed RNA polymerase II subunit RPB11
LPLLLLPVNLFADEGTDIGFFVVPHPLFAKFELRIQTDGEITPKEALVNSCKALVGDLAILSREFTKEYELRKMVSGDAADQ